MALLKNDWSSQVSPKIYYECPPLPWGGFLSHWLYIGETKLWKKKKIQLKNMSTTITHITNSKHFDLRAIRREDPLPFFNWHALKKIQLEKKYSITLATIDNCFIAMVYWNLRQTHLQELVRTQTPTYHAPLSTIWHVGLHVELLFGPLSIHLLVWSELGRSPPSWPMRALTLQWSPGHQCFHIDSVTFIKIPWPEIWRLILI